jgi:hypothetical protein
MLGAMARLAHARPATRPAEQLFRLPTINEKKYPAKEKWSFCDAPARGSQAEQPWGSIRRYGFPARLGAHWEGGM